MSAEDELDPREQEALRERAGNKLEAVNTDRAKIISSVRQPGEGEQERYYDYLSDVDQRLLDLARNEEIFYQLERALDELDREMRALLVRPDLKEAYGKVNKTVQDFGKEFANLNSTDLAFFKHLISEIRATALLLREQTSNDPSSWMREKIRVYLRPDNSRSLTGKDQTHFTAGDKLRRTIDLSEVGVDPAIAAKRAREEVLRGHYGQAERVNTNYENVINWIIGISKDGKLPV